MECIFCKIADGSIPSLKVYDDQKFMAFLDINPRARGHCLIIPKSHYSDLSELSDEMAKELFSVAREIAASAREKLGASGFNIFMNNGKAAGQLIPHLHVHVMPRYEKGSIDNGIAIEAAFPIREDIKPKLNDIQKEMEKRTNIYNENNYNY